MHNVQPGLGRGAGSRLREHWRSMHGHCMQRTADSPAILQAAGGSADHIHNAIVGALNGYGGAVLDFGAGQGGLTRLLLSLGRFDSVAAVDLLPRPPGLDAVDWRVQDLNATSPWPDSAFDVVVAAEVIEHLENPRAVAREWFRLLKPGGHIVLSTPNNESIRSVATLVLKGHFAAFLDSSYPAHITALLRTDLRRVLLEAGFAEPWFRFTDVGGIPKMPSVRWQSISFGLLRGVRFSDNLLCVAQKPSAQPSR